MNLNSKNIILIFFIILFSLIFVFVWNKNYNNDLYKNEYYGIIQEIKSNGKFENSKVLKLKNSTDFNYDFWIYSPIKNDLKINDSISNEKNSFEYKVFRKHNSNGKFEYYKTLNSKP
ncbi:MULTISPECIES: hypothetical protein [Chryseobacterium]|uniref:Uncharacterized protein n=1 Tax=Chryseobacterium taihuense TaxID=1141221 RepID=A0A4U8W8G1_9FLAO|nr:MULTISPECIES: hypothetical protein [Chryseobacterium]QQV04326.1 hypothetical protein I6I61_08320 [Chryseobacterium sp. FDAARGOS 1104]VFB02303.1 Uncharacterised protein [Chryseobacterium taihuense]